jgi:hypothetical protein
MWLRLCRNRAQASQTSEVSKISELGFLADSNRSLRLAYWTVTFTEKLRPFLVVVPVTVMTRGVASLAVDNMTLASPNSFVIAGEPATPPDEAAKSTETSGSRRLPASRAIAVIIAGDEPSAGMLATSVTRTSDEAVRLPGSGGPGGGLPPLPPQAPSNSRAVTYISRVAM